MWIAICIFLIVICYLFLIKPNTGRQEKMKPFEETYIAHRGLFDNGEDSMSVDNTSYNGGVNNNVVPENSIPAFEKAVEAGYGIELDVQTTSDGRLVVFHDETLLRMCGVDRKLYECSYDELQKYHLAKTKERIPLFDEVLKVIDGKVPLIVEIKSEGNWRLTTRLTAERLLSYGGVSLNDDKQNNRGAGSDKDKVEKQLHDARYVYCMESFHPLVVKWFKDNRPDVLRGQLSTNFFRSKMKRAWYEKIILTNLLLNFLAKPDFIAYNYRYKNQPSFWLCRVLFKVVSVAWTVRSEKVLKRVLRVFDVIIFDSFLPELLK